MKEVNRAAEIVPNALQNTFDGKLPEAASSVQKVLRQISSSSTNLASNTLSSFLANQGMAQILNGVSQVAGGVNQITNSAVILANQGVSNIANENGFTDEKPNKSLNETPNLLNFILSKYGSTLESALNAISGTTNQDS